jgi:hypothetical protein
MSKTFTIEITDFERDLILEALDEHCAMAVDEDAAAAIDELSQRFLGL